MPLRDVSQSTVDTVKSHEGIPVSDPTSVNIDSYLGPVNICQEKL